MLSEMNWYRLYKWLYLWSRKKFRQSHMNLYKFDSKCPNCEQWNSIIRVDYENFTLETNHGYMTRCGCCKKTTHWNCDVSILPVPCKPDGTPIVDK